MSTRAKGFTLLEITVATVLLSLVFVVTWETLGVYADSLHTVHVAAELESTIQRISNRMLEEVRESGTEHVTSHPSTDDTSSDSITFQMRIDFTGDPALDWSNLIKYELEASPGETPDNALDDDNDGVVDEQRMVRWEDLNGDGLFDQNDNKVVLADRVTVLTFTRNASVSQFQITFQASVSRSITKGLELLTRTINATVALQNRE